MTISHNSLYCVTSVTYLYPCHGYCRPIIPMSLLLLPYHPHVIVTATPSSACHCYCYPSSPRHGYCYPNILMSLLLLTIISTSWLLLPYHPYVIVTATHHLQVMVTATPSSPSHGYCYPIIPTSWLRLPHHPCHSYCYPIIPRHGYCYLYHGYPFMVTVTHISW